MVVVRKDLIISIIELMLLILISWQINAIDLGSINELFHLLVTCLWKL